MSNLSNVYVEKVYAEHPLAVWTLDEDLGFISFIEAANRDFTNASNWTPTNASFSLVDARLSNPPILEDATTQVTGTVPTSIRDIDIVSVFDYENTVFNSNLANFTLGLYVNIKSVYITRVKIGYRYFDTSTSTTEEEIYEVAISDADRNQWKFIGNTFDLPPATATDIRLVIKLTAIPGGGSANDYISLLNGLSFSQWSEQYNQKTIGSLPVSIQTDINLPESFETIPAVPYGSSDLDGNGFYLVNDKQLMSINYGIPLAYGSSSVTRLLPNVLNDISYPSLIFPGYGFLNNVGRYNDYTVEFWMRINSDIAGPFKIFGPIASSDGLYIEGSFLTLVVNKTIRSHYVGEWFRPMLIQIKYGNGFLGLMVNGEEIFSVEVNDRELVFPNEFDGTKNQNWLGFYTDESIPSFEIDSFAIYPYIVPTEVAKRRWVWGQGVPTLETINSSLNAVTVASDYTVADFGTNYNYPNFGKWSQGSFSNIDPKSIPLTLPAYSLPSIVTGSLSLDKLYDDIDDILSTSEDVYFTFKPNVDWDDQRSRFSFDNFSLLTEPVQSFYGVFESQATSEAETLFRIENLFSGDYLDISLNGTTVSYFLQIDGVLTTINSFTITPGNKFAVGINIPRIVTQEINGINKFFLNQGYLSLLVGGTLTNTFSGKIYRVGFDSQFNARKTESLFSSSGFLVSNTTNNSTLMSHIANYTIKGYKKYNTFYLDIASVGYWEDYIPLSYFGKFVSDFENNQIYDLDFLQFNIDYPENISLVGTGGEGFWTYNDLRVAYSIPVRLTYAELDNNIFTGWANYEQMSQSQVAGFAYDTSLNSIKSYVSFQTIVDGANRTQLDYSTIEAVDSNGVVNPNNLVTNWEDTMYEVLDNTIVYPPKTDQNSRPVDFNSLALVSHIQITTDGLLRKPVRIRDLQIVSTTLNKNDFTPIGTKFGIPAYPYTREGLYYNFVGQNPITLYKESTPYLYTTNNSGWRLRGEFSPNLDRGLSLALNTERSIDFELSAFQMWVKYAERDFPTTELAIASIDFRNGIYDFYLKDDGSGQRGYIIARNRNTGAEVTSLRYFVNGQSVTRAYILKNSWAVVAISFNTPLSYVGYSGRLNLNGPMTYNNVSYFLSSSLERSQSTTNRAWARVKTSQEGQTLLWSSWLDYGEDSTWLNVKVLSQTNAFAVNPKTVYDLYLGINRSIIDDNIDGLEIDYDKSRIYNELVWLNSVKSPV